MKLIVGLGNPGSTYTNSRHNIGFLVVKSLSRIYKIPLKKDRSASALSAKIRIAGGNVMLAMPLTFMNLSGNAVSSLLKKNRIGLEDLLVVCDDLDLEFGRIKLKPRGSSGGHLGINSVIDCIGSEDFARLRAGIGRPAKNIDAADYVLSPFTKRQKQELAGIIEDASLCCQAWVREGITEAMNIFNKRSGLENE